MALRPAADRGRVVTASLSAAGLIHEWNTAILALPTHAQREAAYCDAILSLSVLVASGEQSVERAQSILAAAVAAVTA